jgi:hypothetical protein
MNIFLLIQIISICNKKLFTIYKCFLTVTRTLQIPFY